MTIGRGRFGLLNIALLLATFLGVSLFGLVEARAASPLIRFRIFRGPILRTGLATSVLVSTVIMATMVVGPFYLSRALGLDAALVGLTLSVGPIAAALTAVPAGRLADRFGAQRMYHRAHRHGGRLLHAIYAAGEVWHPRLHCSDRRCHCRLCAVPDG